MNLRAVLSIKKVYAYYNKCSKCSPVYLFSRALLTIVKIYAEEQCTPLYSSGVNDKPVSGFSFAFGKNNEIRKEYLGTGYWKRHHFRLYNGWYFIKTTKNIYIFYEISYIFTVYWAKVTFTYFLIPRKSHFQLQALVHVRPARNNQCQ